MQRFFSMTQACMSSRCNNDITLAPGPYQIKAIKESADDRRGSAGDHRGFGGLARNLLKLAGLCSISMIEGASTRFAAFRRQGYAAVDGPRQIVAARQ
jgi:hypothetical protein